MDVEQKSVLLVLTVGKSDNGKAATMAFSCGMSSLAMGHPVTIFLTSDGSVWGYDGSADEIRVQGFPPLAEMVNSYLDGGGELIICSVCHKTCGSGGPDSSPTLQMLPGVSIGGWASIIEKGMGGLSITF